MNKKLSGLDTLMRKRVLRTLIRVNSELKGNKFTILETRRPQSRQNQLYKEKKSQTLDSYHTRGLAVDCVLKKRWKDIFFWGISKHYQKYNDIAESNGLRSLWNIWKYDQYHLEFAQVFQPPGRCTCYSIVNLLQSFGGWNKLSKRTCINRADRLFMSIKDRNLPRHTKSSLKLCIELEYIKGFRTDKVRDMANVGTNMKDTMMSILKDKKRGILIAQTNKSFGNKTNQEKAQIRHEELRDGKGIRQHIVAVNHVSVEGVWCINSFKTKPSYLIKWEFFTDVVSEVHTVNFF